MSVTYTVLDANGGKLAIGVDPDRQVLLIDGQAFSFENARTLANTIRNLVTPLDQMAEKKESEAAYILRVVQSLDARLQKIEGQFEFLNEAAARSMNRIAAAERATDRPNPGNGRAPLVKQALDRVAEIADKMGAQTTQAGVFLADGAVQAPADPRPGVPAMPSETRREYAGGVE